MTTTVVDIANKTTESTSNLKYIRLASEFSETAQNLVWLLMVLIAIFATLYSLFFFKKKTQKVIQNTITSLKKSKKYIPKLFVELNDIKETLRYFIYSKTWKKRIINDFNLIYCNTLLATS